ncbi:MAG: hypothetical protein ACTSPV_16295, partial [Candidatus Hodarchaeales archaeon]
MSEIYPKPPQDEILDSDSVEAKLRAFMIPIVVVITIAIILSLLTLDYYVYLQQVIPDYTPPDISPVPESPDDPGGIAFGAIINMLFYIAIAFIGGILVLFIIKKGFLQLLSYFFALLMGLSWFTFALFYGGIVTSKILELIWNYLPDFIQNLVNNVYISSLYVFAGIVALLGILTFGIQTFDRIWLRNIMMIFFGAMIGSMFAIHLPLLTAFLILIGLSLYDIYAVFRGPLKGIIDHGREKAAEINEQLSDETEIVYEKVPLLPALPVYSTPLINIGLGDFAFFSMLVSVAVVISVSLVSIIPLTTTLIGLLIGAFYTFKFLEKEKALPGLPLPVFGGIGFLLIGLAACVLLGTTDLA